MPYKIPSVADLEISFSITDVPNIPEIDEENPINVTFRQATEEEDLMREKFVNVPVRAHFDDMGMFEGETRKTKTISERRAYEVYLTLAACDILDRNEKSLIQFENTNGLKKVAGNFPKFQEKWGRLPKAITKVIHEKCLETNPDWDFRWSLDFEEDEAPEEPETPGEE